MKKRTDTAFGKKVYLLGADADGVYYWLEEATWDCDWYWGGGYVETYTNNKVPRMSRDRDSHQHFDVLFFRGRESAFDSFRDFFAETPFSDKEIWKILELMCSFYTARKYSDMLHTGGAHYTNNPASDFIRNEEECRRINTVVIPSIMRELYTILEVTA